MTALPSSLVAWQSYYMIVGSSGAALIGLQFVVVTLIAGTRGRMDLGALSAFATPTVVHLTGALMVAAVMSAPWPSLIPASVVLAFWGIGGLAYGAITFRHALRQSEYKPVWEDWLWFAILPWGAYLSLTLGGLMLASAPARALFLVGSAALGLLLIGIHNAWDTVTHAVVSRRRQDRTRAHKEQEGDSSR
jgi:hypothetical protein